MRFKLLMVGFLVAKPLLGSDLWISVLSLPPQPDRKAFAIYVHCPTSQKQAQLELYEVLDLSHKTRLADVTADAAFSGTDLVFSVVRGGKALLSMTVDRSQSFSVAPFHYHSRLKLDKSIYELTAHQAALSSMILNPDYPEYGDQPLWNEKLSDCTL